MTQPAAISATFSDWRTVKGRKCLQLIFEVPLEQQGQVLEYLGAPMPDQPTWVAVALLNAGSTASSAVDDRPEPPALPAAGQKQQDLTEGQKAVQKAGILEHDTGFQVWASGQSYKTGFKYESTADFIRRRTDVTTRRTYATDPSARRRFYMLVDQYEREMGLQAELRS